LLRAVEARFYAGIPLAQPTLDIGCGDGHFVTVAFNRKIEVGLDPWGPPIREAGLHGGYLALVQGDGGQMPFPDGSFASALSNSVLEHIPHVERVLEETGRVLRPGAVFAFCVPNHQFTAALSGSRFLERLGFKGLARRYERAFNRVARHVHLDPPETWAARLNLAGFTLERYWHYYSPAALAVTEWGHLFGLPSLLSRKLTGRWNLAPQRWNLALTEAFTRPHYRANPLCDDGVCTFYIARKI
jgi:SAM-dependent methyltransferase